MSCQMKLDEMQEALSRANHPQALAFERALCSIGDAMAEALGAALDVEIGDTTQQDAGFAGICCPFNPRYRGQPLPEAFELFDDEEAWAEAAQDKELPPMPTMNPAFVVDTGAPGSPTVCKTSQEFGSYDEAENYAANHRCSVVWASVRQVRDCEGNETAA